MEYRKLASTGLKDVIPAARHLNIGILSHFPLASGLLTGKYTRGEAPSQGTRLAVWGERGAAAISRRLTEAEMLNCQRLTPSFY
jgi:aryl-alcohol dehydrogenase-like predicted oxidoreductase